MSFPRSIANPVLDFGGILPQVSMSGWIPFSVLFFPACNGRRLTSSATPFPTTWLWGSVNLFIWILIKRIEFNAENFEMLFRQGLSAQISGLFIKIDIDWTPSPKQALKWSLIQESL